MRDPDDIHLSVIIPAYNEEERLPKTLREVDSYLGRQAYMSDVIVVDDGSADRTAELVRQQTERHGRTRLIQHPDKTNHGKGASVRLGMAQARGRYRLFMDADNSTSLDQIEGFWGWVEQGYEIVIGSRQVPGARIAVHQPWYKELAGRAGNLLIRALAAPGIRDTQAGFKLFSRRSAETIFPRLTINRWGFDFETLAIARVHGFQVREVPIHWVNSPATRVRFFSYFQVLSEVWHVRRNLRRGLYR